MQFFPKCDAATEPDGQPWRLGVQEACHEDVEPKGPFVMHKTQQFYTVLPDLFLATFWAMDAAIQQMDSLDGLELRGQDKEMLKRVPL